MVHGTLPYIPDASASTLLSRYTLQPVPYRLKSIPLFTQHRTKTVARDPSVRAVDVQ